MKKHEIDKLEIRNELYELGLTVKDIDLLKKKAKEYAEEDEPRPDRYILKRKNNTYGVNGEQILINTKEEIHTPSTKISSTLFPFEIGKDDTKHIFLLLRKLGIDFLKPPLTTIAKIKTALKDELVAHNYYQLKTFGSEDLISFYWLFDQSLNPDDYDDDLAVGEMDIKKIIKVLEYKNYRFSIAKRTDSFYSIKRFNPDNPEYNYIDEGRLFWHKTYVWNDLNEEDIESKILTKCSQQGHYNEFLLVDKDLYERTKKRHNLKSKKEREKEALLESTKRAFIKRVGNLKKAPLEINGITFKHNGIFYEGQEISGTFSEGKTEMSPILSFIDFIKKANVQTGGDFNTLYESFVEELEEREFDGILGQISVRVMKDTTENKKGTKVSRYHINGIRINKDEVVEMLKRAICFDNIDDYNDLLEKVCKCNLKFHDILSGGLDIEFDDTTSVNLDSGVGHLKLKIVRKGSHNYLVLGKEEHKIKNTNRLISKGKGQEKYGRYRRDRPQFEELIGMFKSLFEFDQKQLIALFKDGMRDYKEAVKKSEQFLAETLKLFKVSKAEKDGISGYLITGTSGKKYLLTDDLKIYNYDTLRYLCIVDKDLKGGFKNDKIVSRIYALANDSRVAKHIYTLEGELE